jgi:hypothetical protein
MACQVVRVTAGADGCVQDVRCVYVQLLYLPSLHQLRPVKGYDPVLLLRIVTLVGTFESSDSSVACLECLLRNSF